MKTLNVVDPSDRYFELDSTKRINDFLEEEEKPVSDLVYTFISWRPISMKKIS